MPIIDGYIISAPISVADVAKVLGRGVYDVGGLCRSTNINMWAKHKPVRSSLAFFGKDEKRTQYIPELGINVTVPAYLGDITLDTTSSWYEIEGRDIQVTKMNLAGMVVPMITKASNQTDAEFLEDACAVIRNLNALGELNWGSVYPRGNGVTPNEYYRLTDFDGYNHNAKCTFDYELPDESYGNSDEFGIRFSNNDEDSISFKDDLAQVLGYDANVGLDWELVAIATTEQGYDHKIVASSLLSGENDRLYIEREYISSLGFNVYSYYLYLCAANTKRNRIWFFPEFEGNKPYVLTGFKTGYDPDLDGGIGYLNFSKPTSCYYGSDLFYDNLDKGYYMPLSDLGNNADNAVYPISYIATFAVIGSIIKDTDNEVVVERDRLECIIEYTHPGKDEVKSDVINNFQLYIYEGLDGNQLKWVEIEDKTITKSETFGLIVNETLDLGYNEKKAFGNVTMRYKGDNGRTHTLFKYPFAVMEARFSNTDYVDMFYDERYNTYSEGIYSLKQILQL